MFGRPSYSDLNELADLVVMLVKNAKRDKTWIEHVDNRTKALSDAVTKLQAEVERLKKEA